MEPSEFIALVPNFRNLSDPEKILHVGWFLHAQQKRDRFVIEDVRKCFNALHMEIPSNLARDVSRLAGRKALLKDSAGYRLRHDVRMALDQKYGDAPTTVMLSQMLKDLPGKIADESEKLFLSEALRCYRAQAFRATIVMVWNLAYDHLLRWVLADPQRLSAFNGNIAARVGQKRGAGLKIAKREDFEDLKESEVID